MNPTTKCRACGKSEIVVRSYEEDVEYKGVDLHLTNLEESLCTSCEYAFETHEQLDANADKIRKAFVETRAAFKKSKNLLTGEEIRRVRKSLSLIQHDAAELFGGGLNAFSKYETEEVVQSVAMDKLVRFVGSIGASGVELLRKASTFVPAESNIQKLTADKDVVTLANFIFSESLNRANAIAIEEFVNIIHAPSTSGQSSFETAVGKNNLLIGQPGIAKPSEIGRAVETVVTSIKAHQIYKATAKQKTLRPEMVSREEAKKPVLESRLVSAEYRAA